MRKLMLFVVLSAAVMTACNNDKFKDYETTDTGLRYKFYERGNDTTVAQDGDVMTVLLNYYKSNDSLLNPLAIAKPFQVQLRKSVYKGDIYEGLKLMGEGDSARFVQSVDSFYTKIMRSRIPKELDSSSFFFINVKVLKLETAAQIEAKQQKEMEELRGKEKPLIMSFVAKENITVTPDSNGIYFISEKKGKGKKLRAGDYANINLKINKLDGSRPLYDSKINNNGKGIDYMVGTGYFGMAFDNALANANVGDKFKLLSPSAMAFGARGAEGVVPPYTPLFYEVEVLDTYTEQDYMAKRKKEAEDLKKKEQKDIAKYLNDNNIKATPDADGIYKKVEIEGKGEQVKKGDLVKVLYTGYLLDGTKFDSNQNKDNPFSFIVGTGSVIPGWDKGVSTMKVGEKSLFIIPSGMAYGPTGSGGVIPPNAVLVFEIEVLGVEGK